MQKRKGQFSNLNIFGSTGEPYHGKVREVYATKDGYIVIIATDRISAFDVILPEMIPVKGIILNKIAEHFLLETKDICPNWLISSPHPRVSIGHNCVPFKIEMVIRGYLSGHAWREYKEGKQMICGVSMPEGMKENDKFPMPIITPTTKALVGHDEDISKEEILRARLATLAEYELLELYTLNLFKKGTETAKERGLILVDTKYEFGKYKNEIMLIDEVHTPDSSRYFYADGYRECQENGEPQRQLSKEFVREWLMDNGFNGLQDQKVPDMKHFVHRVVERYQELYEIITGKIAPREWFDSSIDEPLVIEGRVNWALNQIQTNR